MPPAKKKPAKKAAKKPAAKKAIKKKAPAKKGKKDDKPKVKRAPSAYMLFCKKNRAAIVKANPKASFGEVGKLLGAAWAKQKK